MRQSFALPFGPFLLVVVLPYSHWLSYSGIFPISEANRAALLAIAIMMALVVGAWLLSRSLHQAGVIGAIVAAMAFLYFSSPIIPTSIFSLIVATMIIEKKIGYEKVITGVNALGLIMLTSLWPIIQEMTDEPALIPTRTPPIGLVDLTQSPSIVHIVLDGYGSAKTLNDLYHHDTEPFHNALRQRGFVIMEQTYAPFNQTLFVMASIMSGASVALPGEDTNVKKYRENLGYTTVNGPVPRLLKTAGYTIATSRSGYSFFDNASAVQLKETTPWMTGLEASMLPSSMGQAARIHNQTLKDALRPGTLDRLAQPYFYFQHLLGPHPPFTINADGTLRKTISSTILDGSHFVQGSEDRRAEYLAGYKQKAMFIENAILNQFDALPDGPKVVILHGDHGPGAYLSHDSARDSCLAERLATFSAVYSNIPEIRAAFAEKADTPFNLLNLYRTLLPAISDAKFIDLAPEIQFLSWLNPADATAISPAILRSPCKGSDLAITRKNMDEP